MVWAGYDIHEKELKAISDKEKAKCCKFKKRHRKDLDPDEIEEIVAMANKPYCIMKDVAQHFQITTSLASALAKEAVRKPQKLVQTRQRLKLQEQKQDCIEEQVTRILSTNRPIERIKQIQVAVEASSGLKVEPAMVSKVMRKDLGMGYRVAKTVPV